MNTEYVWWAIVLILVGGGAIAFLALGQVPEIEDEPEGAIEDEPAPAIGDEPAPAGPALPAARPSPAGPDQSPPVSSTLPGPGNPSSTSDTP